MPLEPRAQTLLKALVERYIADGQPVGSRALSKISGLDLSLSHHPQHHGRPRGNGVCRQPPYLGRAGAHAARLPHLCRHPADGPAPRRARRRIAHPPASTQQPQKIISNAAQMLSSLSQFMPASCSARAANRCSSRSNFCACPKNGSCSSSSTRAATSRTACC
ncbi:hypothetical protein LP419_23160 [Massilia sp. H-1]|nr:hypothetical protein LP419_23160 [Massilia sp. H-1]